MDVVELHRYYAAYSMKPDKEQEFMVFPFSRALIVIGLMNVAFMGQVIPDGELMEKNYLLHQTDGSMGKEFLEFDFRTEAYRVSDYYIQKSENCKEVPALVAWRNSAVKDLAERVRRLNSVKHTSNYVENARHYIAAHYREKIYLEDIAKKLSISATYYRKCL